MAWSSWVSCDVIEFRLLPFHQGSWFPAVRWVSSSWVVLAAVRRSRALCLSPDVLWHLGPTGLSCDPCLLRLLGGAHSPLLILRGWVLCSRLSAVCSFFAGEGVWAYGSAGSPFSSSVFLLAPVPGGPGWFSCVPLRLLSCLGFRPSSLCGVLVLGAYLPLVSPPPSWRLLLCGSSRCPLILFRLALCRLAFGVWKLLVVWLWPGLVAVIPPRASNSAFLLH